MEPIKIVIVGAGRIGTHLGKRFRAKGLTVSQVLSRNAGHAEALGRALKAEWTADFSRIISDADWVLLAVRDDAIEAVGKQIQPFVPEALVTHTSGATPGAVLAPYFNRYGVFYPLQSFSPNRNPVWSKIPFCVDACKEEDALLLRKIAKIIGNLAYRVNDEQRALLHVAAVFANNFANHCFALAERLMDEADLPFEMLHPLMEETVSKVSHDSPEKMQTGPAIRGDADTIRRHLELLAGSPELEELYRKMTRSINPDLEV